MNKSASDSTVMKGGCLCGAVRYELAAPPAMSGLCCCESCRKLSGSGHAFHAMVAVDALKIKGEVRGYAWQADSGNMVTTSFCPTCGSPLFGKSAGMPGMINFRVASLDDPGKISPQMALYTKRQLSWDYLDPALPTFADMPPRPGSN